MNFKNLTKFSFYLPKSKILLYGNHEYRNEQIDYYKEKLGKNVLKKRWKIIRISSTKKKKCKLQTHINHIYTVSLTSLDLRVQLLEWEGSHGCPGARCIIIKC